MTWALIVLYLGIYQAGATTVTGFTSLKTCMVAAAQLEQQNTGLTSKMQCYCVEVK